MYIYLFLAGLVGGFIAGLAGIGTGFLLIAIIPLALYHLGIPPNETVKLTIANTIFATTCSSFMNNLTTIKKGKFYAKESFLAVCAAIISSVLLLQFAVMQTNYSRKAYNLIIITFLVFVVIRSILKLRKPLRIEESITKIKLLITGLAGGCVAAFTGLGGGSVVMPLLNLWLKIDIKKAKAITYSIIFAVAFVLTIVNLLNTPRYDLPVEHIGYVILPIALPLAAGVIIASPIGVLTSHKVGSRVISYAFISVVTLVIIRKSIEFFS